ncbi:hypothetical protein EIN_093720 [Entamoeba invadens IP1]|uniref:Sphingomyelin synthase-like domain-containing protein n=1 Tax=Entamoeba invadens IP1 TaxID=370355 RepID=A0A0A1TZZ2_ENTIV|nr:hypothetical protein EIN_093720 [Entamoeba invadens IP1]ELP87215.1 hypothetical protein EIN_093720 [Entamoeba invadens IP1]|eukprot:XP_004253986.1 hypothetical protein EIN_093720 [Entamoeba invadens IP1]
MVFGGLLNGVTITYAQEFQRQFQRQHPEIILHKFVLDDYLFDLFGYIDLCDFANKYIGFFIVLFAIRFILTRGRLVVLRRYFFLMGINFLIRSVCLYFTLLNDPAHRDSSVNTNPLFESVLISAGTHVSTVDKLFSGHTSSLTLAGLFMVSYSDKYPLFDNKKTSKLFYFGFNVAICVYVACGWCIFAIARMHYSVDIFIGLLFAFFIFALYHNYIKLAQTRNNSFNKFLIWFEQDADDIPIIQFVENQEPTVFGSENFKEVIIEMQEVKSESFKVFQNKGDDEKENKIKEIQKQNTITLDNTNVSNNI